MEIKTNFLGSLYGHGASYAGAVWDKEMLCPTLTTMQGGGREPMIIIEVKNETNNNLQYD